jgi:glycosyltransferase involved in cell wall biosynthesis
VLERPAAATGYAGRGSPAVSVVVPTHNRPELMCRAVESILAQAYDGAIEVIVVFDGCDPFDPPVRLPPARTLRVVANARRRGLAGARNTGIDAASHDYVAFLDDDDYWLPGKLAAQMPRFRDPARPALVGSAMLVDDGARVFERTVPLEYVRLPDLLRDRIAALHSSTFVFRRRMLREVIGMVDEDLPRGYGEDYDLLLRTAKVAAIAVVRRPLVCVTWAGQSFFFGKWAGYADGLEYLLRRHPEFATDRGALARICSQIAFARAVSDQRAAALSFVRRSLRHDPGQPRAWLALGIATRILPPGPVIRTVQRMGRGI